MLQRTLPAYCCLKHIKIAKFYKRCSELAFLGLLVKEAMFHQYTGAAIIPVMLVVPVTQDIRAFWSLKLSDIWFQLSGHSKIPACQSFPA
jgi:hypothetical protein